MGRGSVDFLIPQNQIKTLCHSLVPGPGRRASQMFLSPTAPTIQLLHHLLARKISFKTGWWVLFSLSSGRSVQAVFGSSPLVATIQLLHHLLAHKLSFETCCSMLFCSFVKMISSRCFCLISFSGHHPITASDVGAQIIIPNCLLNFFSSRDARDAGHARDGVLLRCFLSHLFQQPKSN